MLVKHIYKIFQIQTWRQACGWAAVPPSVGPTWPSGRGQTQNSTPLPTSTVCYVSVTSLWMCVSVCVTKMCYCFNLFVSFPVERYNSVQHELQVCVCVCTFASVMVGIIDSGGSSVGREEFISEVSNKTKLTDVWGKSNFNKIFGHIRLKWIDLDSDFLKPFLHSGEDAQLQILWSALRWWLFNEPSYQKKPLFNWEELLEQFKWNKKINQRALN